MDEEARKEMTEGDVTSAERSATEVVPAASPPPRGRRRWRRWLKAALAMTVVIAVGAVAWLSQTPRGQQIVFDEVLARVRASLAGELTVGDIHSRTLLFGLTLTNVRLDAAGGRRFLIADSIVVRYSPLTLALGSPRIRSTTFHGLDLEISRYPGEESLNVQRVLAPSPAEDSTSVSPPSTIGLGRIGVRRGMVRVLMPAEAATGPFTEPAPGGALSRLTFADVDLDLEETIVRPGGAVSLDARLASLTTSIFLRQKPLVIHEAQGALTFGVTGLEIQDAAFRMPGSLVEGNLRFGPDRSGDPWTLVTALRTDGWGDLADLQWIDARIPAGRFRGGADLRAADGIDVALRSVEVQLEASTVQATGRAHFGDALVLRDMQITASPLVVSRLEPWLGRDIPMDGFLSGRATFSGEADSLQAVGRVTLVPAGLGGGSTTADFSGIVHLGEDPGATNLNVQLNPLNYRILHAVWAGADAFGSGSGTLQLNGRVDEGFMFVADFAHAGDDDLSSRVTGTGLLRRLADGRLTTNARGQLGPLSLPLLGRVWPDLDLHGAVAGPVQADGPLDSLHFTGDLMAGDGRLVVEGTADLTSPMSSYRLEADAETLQLSDFSDRVPSPSIVSGHLALAGGGFALDSLHGAASLALRGTTVGEVRIDSATASLRAADGVLTVDSLRGEVSGVRLMGGGTLGLVEASDGEAEFGFDVPSLLSLRPVFMGDSLLVRDELNPLEQDLLRARGIDPDTLPTALDVRMAGSAHGTARVHGRLGDLSLNLMFEMADAAYGPDQVDSASVALSADGLPATFGDWSVDARAVGVVWADREFQDARFTGTMSNRRGDGTLDILRGRNERYFLSGAFALDSLGGEVDLQEGSIRISDLSWALTRPTSIVWNEASLTVDSLEFDRVGDDPMRLVANGTLTRGGDSDFRLDMEGFHVEHAMQIAQREDIDMSGHVDLSLTVQGPAERPIVNALFQVQNPRYGAMQLSRLSGSLQYQDRLSTFRVDAWDGSRDALIASGTLPFDLAFTEVERRTLEEPMDVQLSADSLDAKIALAYLRTLQDVAGTVSADIHIGGTSRAPEPSGTVMLNNGAWTIEALGVRHTGLTGELTLHPDRTVDVSLATLRQGSTVSGELAFPPDSVSNPRLDLLVTFNRFQAVDRRDMESMISGQFEVTGTYHLPVATGSLTVDQGTLFVEEFARAAQVVDLSDPTLFADGFAVDTTVFVAQPLLASIRNPFLDNLRLDIDLSVPRDMWLRSSDMNVEIGGQLQVRYDRRQNDLVLIGDLEALRGSYLVLGRTFDVDQGTVSFIGQPGINPSLEIQATSRIRRREEDQLEVVATVEGTLVHPIVTLSTEEAGLSQADLISYLVFGRASGELGRDAAQVGSETLRGGVTYLTGALANQIGAALGQGIGIDYLSISQGASFGDSGLPSNLAGNLGSLAQNAQVEAGWYLGNDVFVVLVLGRPGGGATGEGSRGFFLRGLRVEFPWTDAVSVEGFAEDRFLRSGASGFPTSGLEGYYVVGLFVFSEWGYGSKQ
jgi:TamB, inner membrane protein subunit of TAM complex